LFPLTLDKALDTLFGVHSEMAILSNLCACPVECEAYSSGVMLIPPLAGLEVFLYIHPKGTYFVAPAVNPAVGGTHALTLNKISHFWTDTS
jgi:hypothetical protein